MLLPRQRSKLARGANDKEHAMSQNLNSAVAVIGIDIGKNSFLKVSVSASRLILRRKAILPSALKPTMWKTSLPISMPIEAKGGCRPPG